MRRWCCVNSHCRGNRSISIFQDLLPHSPHPNPSTLQYTEIMEALLPAFPPGQGLLPGDDDAAPPLPPFASFRAHHRPLPPPFPFPSTYACMCMCMREHGQQEGGQGEGGGQRAREDARGGGLDVHMQAYMRAVAAEAAGREEGRREGGRGAYAWEASLDLHPHKCACAVMIAGERWIKDGREGGTLLSLQRRGICAHGW